jgi:hypothetical protein
MIPSLQYLDGYDLQGKEANNDSDEEGKNEIETETRHR